MRRCHFILRNAFHQNFTEYFLQIRLMQILIFFYVRDHLKGKRRGEEIKINMEQNKYKKSLLLNLLLNKLVKKGEQINEMLDIFLGFPWGSCSTRFFFKPYKLKQKHFFSPSTFLTFWGGGDIKKY